MCWILTSGGQRSCSRFEHGFESLVLGAFVAICKRIAHFQELQFCRFFGQCRGGLAHVQLARNYTGDQPRSEAPNRVRFVPTRQCPCSA